MYLLTYKISQILGLLNIVFLLNVLISILIIFIFVYMFILSSLIPFFKNFINEFKLTYNSFFVNKAIKNYSKRIITTSFCSWAGSPFLSIIFNNQYKKYSISLFMFNKTFLYSFIVNKKMLKSLNFFKFYIFEINITPTFFNFNLYNINWDNSISQKIVKNIFKKNTLLFIFLFRLLLTSKNFLKFNTDYDCYIYLTIFFLKCNEINFGNFICSTSNEKILGNLKLSSPKYFIVLTSSMLFDFKEDDNDLLGDKIIQQDILKKKSFKWENYVFDDGSLSIKSLNLLKNYFNCYTNVITTLNLENFLIILFNIKKKHRCLSDYEAYILFIIDNYSDVFDGPTFYSSSKIGPEQIKNFGWSLKNFYKNKTFFLIENVTFSLGNKIFFIFKIFFMILSLSFLQGLIFFSYYFIKIAKFFLAILVIFCFYIYYYNIFIQSVSAQEIPLGSIAAWIPVSSMGG